MAAQMVKNLHKMQETKVQSLDREDPLEKGMATHSRKTEIITPFSVQFSHSVVSDSATP